MQLAPPGHIGATRVPLRLVLDEMNQMSRKGGTSWNKGIPATPEHRQKISDACRGKPQPWDHAHHRIQHTPEAKAKMSQRRREWWARRKG